MAIRKCSVCGRTVPEDENQLVHDRVVVAMKKLTLMFGVEINTFVSSLLDEAAICARCFNEKEMQEPLQNFAAKIEASIVEHPSMFRWTLVQKGKDHVD